MIKKILLLSLVTLTPQYSLKAMLRYCPEAFDDSKISRFGVLSNASADDKEAYGRFLESLDPMVMVADKYKKAEVLTHLVVDMEVWKDNLKDRIRALNINVGDDGAIDSGTYVNILRLAPIYNTSLFDKWRKFAVICSAHGSFVRPDHDKFKECMGSLLIDVIIATLDASKCAMEKHKIDLKKAQEGEAKWIDSYLEISKKNAKDLEATRKELKKLEQKAKASMAQNEKLHDTIDQMKSAVFDFALELETVETQEKEFKDNVKSKRAQHEQKEKDLRERNEELQGQRDKSRQEKAVLIERFGEEIAKIGASAIQRHELALDSLREEMSPLQKELAPLRATVAAQKIELEKKDAEIERLRKALVDLQLKK